MAPMAEQRGSLAAVALDGKIFALGGGRPGVQSKRVEILEPNINIWMQGKAMLEAR